MESAGKKKKFQPTKEVKHFVDSNGCHVCTSHKGSGDGYPGICINGERWVMSRYIYTQLHGEIPEGKVVRHTCDNIRCINPAHLIIGTLGDNNRDRAERGRSRNQNGDKNNMAKLAERDVIKIFSSKHSVKKLAHKFGITKNQVWNIKSGKRWASVTDPIKKEYQVVYIDKEISTQSKELILS